MDSFEDYTHPDANLSWHEHIRKRPGMYLGRVNNCGFSDLIRGLFRGCFAVSNVHKAQLNLLSDNSAEIIIETDGISTPSFRTAPPNDPIGIELMVLAASSATMKMQLFAKDNKVLSVLNFEEGRIISKRPQDQSINCHTLKVSVQLDPTIWGEYFAFNEDYILQSLRELAFLHPTVELIVNYLKSGENCKAIYQFPNGLADYLDSLTLDGLGSTRLKAILNFTAEDFTVDVAVGFRQYGVDNVILKSYANGIYTFHEGTHVDALFQGLSAGLLQYLKENVLEGDFDLSAGNLRKTLIGCISVVLDAPAFANSTKSKLGNQEIIAPISEQLAQHFYARLTEEEANTRDFFQYHLSRKN